jgi:hypothetical protein
MNEVIAVEPEAFKDASEFLGFIGHFGFHQGRFVGVYPKKWVQQVIKNLDDKMTDHERTLVVEQLKKEKLEPYRTLAIEADFKPAPVTWIENAAQRKQEGIFSDVIVARGDSTEFTSLPLLPGYFDKFPRDMEVLSSPDSYAEAARILLTTASEIALFDPYLSKGRDTWKTVLNKFANVASAGICEEFKIFTFDDKYSPDKLYRWATQFYQDVRKYVKVTHYVLRDKGNIEADDHSRYLISMKGALSFDKGFASDYPAPRKRRVSVVDRVLHEKLRMQYLEDIETCLPFEIVDKPLKLDRIA